MRAASAPKALQARLLLVSVFLWLLLCWSGMLCHAARGLSLSRACTGCRDGFDGWVRDADARHPKG